MPNLLAVAAGGTEAVKGIIDDTIVNALSSGFGAITTDITTIVKTALPSALVVFGLFFALRKGISFFRGIAG